MALSNRQVLSISELNRQARELLENGFGQVYVEGELSNFSRPSSGHWYFTLKDDKAQIRCAMFRNRNRGVPFKPEDGAQVVVRGRVSIYEGRGDFQLIAEDMEEAGDGALRRAFEQLKQKLLEEGLFDRVSKKTLPLLPVHVGVITSPTGAAIRDVIHVMGRRFPAIAVSILPVQVQGEAAAGQISAAINLANQYMADPIDVLLITRGGGSLEDLWSFNTEQVARAIHGSQIPIVTAIGHEVDFTIADFVADLRAATPSAAAEMICPDQNEWLTTFRSYQNQLIRHTRNRLRDAMRSVEGLSRRLRHPGQRLQDQSQRLDDLEIRLKQAARNQVRQTRDHLQVLSSRLQNPLHRVSQSSLVIKNLLYRLTSQVTRTIKDRGNQLAIAAQSLNTLSPLATLERGYAIISSTGENPRIVTNVTDLEPGDLVSAQVHQGEFTARIEEIHDETTN